MNMHTYSFFTQFLKVLATVLIVQILLSSNAFALKEVGSVISLRGIIAVQTGNGDNYFLAKDSAIFEGDTISSTKKSFAVLGFLDQSKVVVKQESIFKVEGFDYGTDNDVSTFSLLKGGIRAVSGAIAKNNPDNYKLNTSVVSLGVRGTAYDAQICEGECLTDGSGSQKIDPAVLQNSDCKIQLGFKKPRAGVYFTVRDGGIILDNGREQISLSVGDVGFADDQSLGCLPSIPEFMFEGDVPLPESEDFRGYSLLQCTASNDGKYGEKYDNVI